MGAASRGSVVVTGASSGIGEACAWRLEQLGFQVFAGVRGSEAADKLRARRSSRLQPILIEVTDPESVSAAAQTISKSLHGRGLSGLVNNAGVAVLGPLEFVPLDMMRRQLEVNVIGQMAMIQALMPLLRRGRGRVVNIGSISGLVSSPFLGPYCASKFALEALTDALRLELRPSGMRVSIIEGGYIATPIWQKSAAAMGDVIQSLPPGGLDRYGDVLSRLRGRASRARGMPADKVAVAVAHALTARRPRTRYLVGRGTRRQASLRCLPARLRDWLLTRKLPPYG